MNQQNLCMHISASVAKRKVFFIPSLFLFFLHTLYIVRYVVFSLVVYSINRFYECKIIVKSVESALTQSFEFMLKRIVIRNEKKRISHKKELARKKRKITKLR